MKKELPMCDSKLESAKLAKNIKTTIIRTRREVISTDLKGRKVCCKDRRKAGNVGD